MTPDSIASLVHRILDQHHARLHKELPELEAGLAALEGHGKQLTAPMAHLRRTLDEHMNREELVLFPVLLGWAEGQRKDFDVAAAVAGHEAEHDKLRTLEDAMRQAARDAGPYEARLLDLLDDLVEHLRIEEQELHPAILAMAPALAVDAPPSQPTPDRKSVV